MAVEIAPLLAADLAEIELQASQAHMRKWMGGDFGAAIEAAGNCATALLDGVPVACAGICDLEGRRYAWAFLGHLARPVMLAASRACAEALSRETSDVFTHCRMDVPANARWLKLLGFGPTGTSDVLPDGMTYELWVRRNDR
mgnify:CR=1 FL=1